MAITAGMVRELRDKTGAAMMDCKKALDASAGDMDAAVDHLRKTGLKTAAKKAGRETSEGRVAAKVADSGKSGALVAVRCETDFVANTDDFAAMMEEFTGTALANEIPDTDPVDAFGNMPAGGSTVSERLQAVVGKLGENMQVGGVAHFENAGGYVGAYVHHNNKIGVLASVTTGADAGKAAELLKKLCQHAAAYKPSYLNRDEVPADVIERERAVYAESEDVQKKPEQFRDKIITGKLEKFYAETCLVEQGWIMDDKQSVAKALEQELGAGTKIERFALFEV